MDSFTPTGRTTLRRLPKRGVYDRAAVYGILDEGFICHVAFLLDSTPAIVPTAYGRSGDRLYIHGSVSSRMLKAAASGSDLCIAVTLVDGLVLARSAFHHSINYRSVILFGKAQPVTEIAAKREALRIVSDHIVPGRWDEVRPPVEREIAATTVLSVPLEEVSAKVRTGPPVDDEEDYDRPVWAGVLPLALVAGSPLPDERLGDGIEPSRCVTGWRRSQS
jgi:nitroimidazol reductase NimA-like FMN-containing flavoprotein (pyridoxamine 5'-phosphate oxidase superfamily)